MSGEGIFPVLNINVSEVFYVVIKNHLQYTHSCLGDKIQNITEISRYLNPLKKWFLTNQQMYKTIQSWHTWYQNFFSVCIISKVYVFYHLYQDFPTNPTQLIYHQCLCQMLVNAIRYCISDCRVTKQRSETASVPPKI